MSKRVKPAPEVLIVGCGDIGSLLAGNWRERGARVAALARSAASVARLQGLGLEIVRGDLDEPGTLKGIPLAGTLLYYLAPPPAGGEGDSRVEHLLAAISQKGLPRRIVYLSTSGVYGDTGGAWVNEQTPPNPQTARARRRLAAENAMLDFGRTHGVEVLILRVGGIYGPGRLPLERIEKDLPVLNEDECGYTNRIHAEDLVTILLAAAERGRGGEIYNVSDGQPGTMTGYFYAVADAFGLPRPPALSLAEARQRLSPAMLSYLEESRRMDNRKLLREFGITLRYPDLASGLRDIKQFKVKS